MYKPQDSETGGGGQTYIDFPTQAVSVADWNAFFQGVPGVAVEQRAQGPAWTAPIRSIGLGQSPQPILFYQRRAQSVSVAGQTLGRTGTNRVPAWHPANGFPEPADSNNRTQLPAGLGVFFVKATDSTLWAGWFLNNGQTTPPADDSVRIVLSRLLVVPQDNRDRAGVIDVGNSDVWLDEGSSALPFRGRPSTGPVVIAVAPPAATAQPPLAPSPGSPPGSGEPIANVRSRETARATDSQGQQLDPARRKAVEMYAMTRAIDAYPGAENVSATQSYDLCTSEGAEEVRVEVKGTLGSGDFVLLTANEVSNSRGQGWRTDLFIVSNIQLAQANGEYIASGGEIRIITGWTAEDMDLTPTQFRYRVPR